MRHLVLYFLPYLTVLVFVFGCAYRVAVWLRAPVPLKIPITPGPKTYTGIIAQYAGEILIFRTLFAGDKFLWAASWAFHVLLALVLGGHVVGILFSQTVCDLLDWTPLQYERFSAIVGAHLGLIIVIPLLYLFVRRMRHERVRYVSGFGDYFALLLLLGIVITGDCLRFVTAIHLTDVHDYLLGLIIFQFREAPRSAFFTWHFFLVNLLVMYAPFGKLVHAGGVFFSPTRNQRDNAREQRHINPWDAGAAEETT